MRYRQFEPVDVATVSGALLTVFGGILFWVATLGSFQMAPSMQPNPGIDMKMLEEEMGKNVVAASQIEDKHSKEIARAAKRLNAETVAAEHVNNAGNETVQHVIDEHQKQEQSKAARIEFVKGQGIVNATLRAKRMEQLSEEGWQELNQRAITIAANEGNRIERSFRLHAPETLNKALEMEAQAHSVLWHRSQEEAGAAIVKTSVVEKEYELGSSHVQEQIGSLVSRAAASDML
jgi:Fe2+ transport system protein B